MVIPRLPARNDLAYEIFRASLCTTYYTWLLVYLQNDIEVIQEWAGRRHSCPFCRLRFEYILQKNPDGSSERIPAPPSPVGNDNDDDDVLVLRVYNRENPVPRRQRRELRRQPEIEVIDIA